MRIPGIALAIILCLGFPAAAQQERPDWKKADIELTKKMADSIEAAHEEAMRLIREGQDPGLAATPELPFQEYFNRVVRPRLKAARTCRQRMDAVQGLVAFARTEELLGGEVKIDTEFGNVTVGDYGRRTLDRCMNESYRRCVVEDEPTEVFNMVGMVLGWHRTLALMGGKDTTPNPGDGLDRRIAQCRGPWFRVRLTREARDDNGELYLKDVVEGWTGRGLDGGYTRHVESHGIGARCPDGDCDETCRVTKVADGKAEVQPKPYDRDFFIRFTRGAYNVRTTEDSCPANASPDLAEPDATFTAHVPGADPVTSLTGGAPDLSQVPVDPKAIASIDPWPHLFAGTGTFELMDEWDEKIGRIEVLEVCDGREMYGTGSATCKDEWTRRLASYDNGGAPVK